jgi:uncharacterized protein YkwD
MYSCWKYCNSEILAQNWAATPQTSFDQWKNDPSHNAAMLGNYTLMGAVLSGTYSTVEFK